MSDNQYLLESLRKMMGWKKSKSFYADKLGISEKEIKRLMKQLNESEDIRKDAEVAAYVGELEDAILKFEEDLKKGTGEVVLRCNNEIRTLDELIEKCKIDTSKWEVVKYVQNYWGNSNSPHWQVKTWLSKKKEENLYQDSFIEFLKTYQPNKSIVEPSAKREVFENDVCLVINKQDAHYNKFDVGGDNSIADRFRRVDVKLNNIINQASIAGYLAKTIYIIGSDEFNSEFTNTTTKGTPQDNILTYHKSFEMICNHETRIIDKLLEMSQVVDVIYIPGNHDEYVGWHLINWLEAYYREESRVKFDTSPAYRKYVSYGNTAMMFNHGDVMKAQSLATVFPMEYKHSWSDHEYFYVFTGDRHHEVTQSINGIKFYQIPAFSNAKSSWDDRKGYTCVKGEVTAFLIDEIDGMTNIYKQYL